MPHDDVQLSELKIKPNMKIMMMGTCEETIAAANEKPDDIGEVIDDFDFEETEIQTDQRYIVFFLNFCLVVNINATSFFFPFSYATVK